MEPWIIKEADSSTQFNILELEILLTKRFLSLKWELGGLSLDILTVYVQEVHKKSKYHLKSSHVLELKPWLILTAIVLICVEITIMNSVVEPAQRETINLWAKQPK